MVKIENREKLKKNFQISVIPLQFRFHE